MELSCKQIYRLMKQNVKSRNEHMHIGQLIFSNGERTVFSKVLEKLYIHMKKH